MRPFGLAQASPGSCGRGSGTAVPRAAGRRRPAAGSASCSRPTARAAAAALRRSSLPTKPPYRSSSTSGVASRAGRANTARQMPGERAARAGRRSRHGAAPASTSSAQRCAAPAPSVFRLPMTIGDLLTWMRLDRQPRRRLRAGRRPAREQALAERRRRSGRRARPGRAPDPRRCSSFLFVGCGASGQTSAMQPRSTPIHARDVQERPAARRSRPHTASLRRSRRQKSHSRGWRVLISRASAIVARTSDSASCAASCAMPLARVRCSSLNDGRPSSCSGHSMPSGRSAQAARTTSSRSQRPHSFCHSRAYGSIRLRQNRKRVTSSSKRIVL